MTAKIILPSPLRLYAGNVDSLSSDGRTITEVLGQITSSYPDLGKHILTADGRLRSLVNIYLNNTDIRELKRGDTPVGPEDEIRIIPAIAGGMDATASSELTPAEFQRYNRHLILPEVGVEGQMKLKSARVLTIGAGGLGSPIALYLAAAGIGTLGIVDFDVVDVSNLQRQIIHSTSMIGKSKLVSAKERIHELNPEVNVRLHETRLTSMNALEIFSDYDIVIDGSDNFPTRYLVNDACVLLGKPNVYGSIFRFDGQASIFGLAQGPCYRCLYPEPPPAGLVPSCAEGGVLGILPGIIGLIQATEAVKLIVGVGSSLSGRLLLFDALQMRFTELKLSKDPNCLICSAKPKIQRLIDYEQFCISQTKSSPETSNSEIEPMELKQILDQKEDFYLLDVREPHEWRICSIPGANLIPLGQLTSNMGKLNKEKPIVVYCRSGIRSGKAADLLRKAGFTKVTNLRGGILGWCEKVDPSMPK